MRKYIMRVLLIDDEQTFLMGLKDFLESYEMTIHTAEAFEDAEALLNAHTYDAAIIDVRLTGILCEQGLDILESLKKNKPHLRVIVATGYGSSDIKQRAYKLGAEFFFEKPVSGHVLLDALTRTRNNAE
jgi:DNA-binding NtrC family response regulator